jgi:drug/metabolite transporter (DMT)-like permease
MGSLVGLIGLVAISYMIFRTSRESARESAAARRRAIVGALIMMLTGAVMAFWLTRYVPETPGSPGTLVFLTLLWLLGGCMLFLGAIALAGGIVARPGEPHPADDPF